MFSSIQHDQWSWCYDGGRQCTDRGCAHPECKSCYRIREDCLSQTTLTNTLTLLNTVRVLLWSWPLVSCDVWAYYTFRCLLEGSFSYPQKLFSLMHRLSRALVWAGQHFHCLIIHLYSLIAKRLHWVFPLICQGGSEAQS